MTRGSRLGVLTFGIELLETGGVTTPAPTRQEQVDLIVDCTPTDVPCIPGTSLAGAMRAHVREVLGATKAAEWFGHVDAAAESGRTGDDRRTAAASGLWTFTAPAEDGTAPAVQRWTTAIDRRRGAARVRTLRGVEVLVEGTVFRAVVLWGACRHEDLEQLVGALGSWRPAFGRGVSTGSGRCAIRGLRFGVADLEADETLLHWLTLPVAEFAARHATRPATPAGTEPVGTHWTLGLRLAGPLLVSAQQPGDRRGDARTYLTSRDGAPLIPGTTMKGVLRSRVEFVLRAVGLPACEDQTCGQCRPCMWFGHAGGLDAGQGRAGRRAQVRFVDSRVADQTDGIKIHVRRTTHVAIDRFMGGAAAVTKREAKAHEATARGGLLFTVEAPDSGDLVVAVDVTDVPEDERPLLGALLRLALTDLTDGLVGIGHATTRGYGSVAGRPAATAGLPTIRQAQTLLAAATAGQARAGGGGR